MPLFVADPMCQRTLYFDSGGQPGHRAAWTDDRVNAVVPQLFPQYAARLWIALFCGPATPATSTFQDRAGAPIRDYMRKGGDAHAVLAILNGLYHESQKEGAP